MEEADGVAGGGEFEGAGEHFGGDAVGGCLRLVELVAAAGLIVFTVPIDVDDAVGIFEDGHDLFGDVVPALGVGSVDFGDEGLEDGRAGGDFGDLDAGVELFGDGQEALAHLAGDGVGVTLAFVFVFEVDLDVGHVGGGAQEVMTDEAVEVIGAGGAGVSLDVGNFGLVEGGIGQGAGAAGRLFERGAFGHVDDDLELALVVEGQHLYLNKLDVDEAAGGEQHDGHGAEEGPAEEGHVDKAIHPAAVEDGEFVFVTVVMAGVIVFEQANGGPGRYQERD